MGLNLQTACGKLHVYTLNYFDINEERYMPPVKNFKLSDWQIALITLLCLVMVLSSSAWYLGKQQATAKFQTTVANLEEKNTYLAEEVEHWKEKALAAGPVSAETAMEIMLAEYPLSEKMVSLEYPYSDCDRLNYFQTISDWPIPFTEKAYTIKWSGVITAGINMSEVSIHTNKAGDKLIVTVPNAEILGYEIDDESFELLDEQNNIFNPISLEDLLKMDFEIEKSMKSRVNEEVILDQAQDNAVILITDVLRSHPAIGSYYEIEFKQL